ncbi:MAG: DJ-1/PfpI family protein [Clostridia bacterium]|nr:DJ-1/PfpI family protein [Clostridia bacterium]
MVTVFLAEGFEEIEAISPIDILRRAGVQVRTCSITESKTVIGAHGIPFVADLCMAELSDEEDLILLPGGMPGTLNLKNCEALRERMLSHREKGGLFAAICAAPTVYGALGFLKEEKATCYPGMEGELFCKEVRMEPVVVSGRFVTSRGAGTAFAFGLKLVEILCGNDAARALAKGMCFEEGQA